jgi:hypothetical protein
MTTLQQIKNLAINNINGDKESLILTLNKIVDLVDNVPDPINNNIDILLRVVSKPFMIDAVYLFIKLAKSCGLSKKEDSDYIKVRNFLKLGISCLNLNFNDVSTFPKEWQSFIETGHI